MPSSFLLPFFMVTSFSLLLTDTSLSLSLVVALSLSLVVALSLSLLVALSFELSVSFQQDPSLMKDSTRRSSSQSLEDLRRLRNSFMRWLRWVVPSLWLQRSTNDRISLLLFRLSCFTSSYFSLAVRIRYLKYYSSFSSSFILDSLHRLLSSLPASSRFSWMRLSLLAMRDSHCPRMRNSPSLQNWFFSRIQDSSWVRVWLRACWLSSSACICQNCISSWRAATPTPSTDQYFLRKVRLWSKRVFLCWLNGRGSLLQFQAFRGRVSGVSGVLDWLSGQESFAQEGVLKLLDRSLAEQMTLSWLLSEDQSEEDSLILLSREAGPWSRMCRKRLTSSLRFQRFCLERSVSARMDCSTTVRRGVGRAGSDRKVSTDEFSEEPLISLIIQ